MRYFLATYDSVKNFEISQRYNVFGAPKNKAGLTTKVKKLVKGDVIVIRNGSLPRHSFGFLGWCSVIGEVFDQDVHSPYKNLLWSDEEGQIVKYPFRISANFTGNEKHPLNKIHWSDLDALQFQGTRSIILKERQAWAKKFCGNFIEKLSEVEAFSKLVGLKIC